MRQSIRLVVNAATLFSRMLVTFGIGLYITRLLLDLLGASDFGLLAALGASGSLLMLVTPALNTGAIRNLAYELGHSDPRRAIGVFNATLVLFGSMGLAILAAGLLVAGPLLSALTIPEGREQAAAGVLYMTLANLALTTVGTPFRGAVEARQAMGQVAAGEVVRSLLNLAAVGLLLVVEGDPLVVYSAGLLASTVLRMMGNAAIAMVRFPEVRVRPSSVRWAEVRRLASFTGWTTLIRVGAPLHAQAGIVLIGIAFSPVVTSAYGIAMRLRGYHSHLTKVLPRVVQPAMTTKEARGERGYVQDLALMTSKYSALGSLFVIVPLLIETHGILDLWLREVPAGTALFARLTLAWMTVEVLGSGIERAIFAQGAVRGYGVFTLALWVGSLGLCALWFLGLGLGPAALAWTYLGTTLAHLLLTVAVGARLVDLPAWRWWRESAWPVAAPAIPATAAALAVHAALPDAWPRYLAVAAAYGLVAVPFGWWWSIGPKEKRVLARGMGPLRQRLQRVPARTAPGDAPPA